MRLVTAIIRPERLEEVRRVLVAHGVTGMTVSQASGHGRQRGRTEVYRGAEHTVDFVPKVRLEVLVEDLDVEAVVALVVDVSRTGRIGDGKVWVAPIEHVVRVRTGEKGERAL